MPRPRPRAALPLQPAPAPAVTLTAVARAVAAVAEPRSRVHHRPPRRGKGGRARHAPRASLVIALDCARDAPLAGRRRTGTVRQLVYLIAIARSAVGVADTTTAGWAAEPGARGNDRNAASRIAAVLRLGRRSPAQGITILFNPSRAWSRSRRWTSAASDVAAPSGRRGRRDPAREGHDDREPSGFATRSAASSRSRRNWSCTCSIGRWSRSCGRSCASASNLPDSSLIGNGSRGARHQAGRPAVSAPP